MEDDALPGLFVVMALGRFAGSDLARPRFLARNQLRDRLLRTERNGGWPTLARTTVADVADHLWQRRTSRARRAGRPPAGAAARRPDAGEPSRAVWATTWWPSTGARSGVGPVGADLGYFALSAREEFEPLVEAYLIGLPDTVATREQVELGARVAAVYTALSRAEWALARVAGGEGALAGKYRHPAVAPHLRTLQRQSPQVEALLEA